jgi:hypothetical protein
LQQEAEERGLLLHAEAKQSASLHRQQESGIRASAPTVSFAELLLQLPQQPDSALKVLRSRAMRLSRAQLDSCFRACQDHSLLALAAELLSVLVQRQSPQLNASHLTRVLSLCFKQGQWAEGLRIFSCSVSASYLPPTVSQPPSHVASSSSLVPDISCYNFLLKLLLKQAAEAAGTASSSVEQVRAAYAAPLSLAAWLMSSPLFPTQPSPPSSSLPLAFDCFTYSLLVSLSARCRKDASLSDVLERLRFQQLPATTVLSCSISHALHRAGRYEETLQWFSQAQQAEAADAGDGQVDSLSCMMAIHAAVKLGLHEDAVRTHRYMQRRGLQLISGTVYAKLIIAYTYLGYGDQARRLQQEAQRKGIELRGEPEKEAPEGEPQFVAEDRPRPRARGMNGAGDSGGSGSRGRLVSELYAT